MRGVIKLLILVTISALISASRISAHCEIPCGIYDDELRIKTIAEHIVTIEKSMKQITSLSEDNPVNYNQLVRWISNKDSHADEIQHIVSQYFMTQRIKPETVNYTEKLKTLHGLIISAMKCKQTNDVTHVERLRTLLKEFDAVYFEKVDR
jgi:nickel superoxide dismutase